MLEVNFLVAVSVQTSQEHHLGSITIKHTHFVYETHKKKLMKTGT